MIGAVLTQQTSWRNVGYAMRELRRAKVVTLQQVADVWVRAPARLCTLIRSSGFYNTKARYLGNLARFVTQEGGVRRLSTRPLPRLRQQLLELPGLGPETTDSIILYALAKPIFVIDEYTHRFVRAWGVGPSAATYHQLQQYFMASLPKNYRLYQDFHALIVIDAKARRKAGAAHAPPFRPFLIGRLRLVGRLGLQGALFDRRSISVS